MFIKTKVERLHGEIDSYKEEFRFAIGFIESIAEGKIKEDNPGLDNSKLIQALERLRSKMLDFQLKEQQNSWQTTGLLELADILRTSGSLNDNVLDTALSFIVKHIHANQGAIFIINHTDPNDVFFELVSIYASEKKRHAKMRVDIHDGLIGQCYFEGEEICITQVPSNYVKIRSGLGEATPKSLVLLPLKMDDRKIGVMEFALFKPLHPHQIKFLTIASESLTSFILSRQAKQELETKQAELEQIKLRETELLNDKLNAQDAINQTIINRLKMRIKELEQCVVLS